MSTPRPYILLRDDLAGREMMFQQPVEIVTADRLEDVEPALRRLDGIRRTGKWLAGYLSYEAGFAFEPKLAALLPEGRRVPLLQFGIFDMPDERVIKAPVPSNAGLHDARATWTFEDYRARFEKLHCHLRKGDAYQGNLTFPVTARWEGAPRAVFEGMTARQPVRYGALVELGGPAIVSRSPELFFQVDRDNWIETHPMKGTIRRGVTPKEDAELAEFLRNDPKNQAENRMIVDLLRNDISRVTEVGTLDVPELFRIESYPTVHQMVSRVRARLEPSVGLTEIMQALFPCGSITGAPKLSAMMILNALERQPRDAYCGAIGWAAPGGEMRFSVAIRTVTLHEGGEAVFNVGGGVVFDSDARSEYEECLLKARFATGSVPTTA
ncbi:MAG: aminodeoxychorismate synthase component I [Rhizobiaceae bacterium]|nr:aminodeoxychorismate synthase component I [Rhizobiaceae bacterium]